MNKTGIFSIFAIAAISLAFAGNASSAYYIQGQTAQMPMVLTSNHYNTTNGELYADYSYNYTWLVKAPL